MPLTSPATVAFLTSRFPSSLRDCQKEAARQLKESGHSLLFASLVPPLAGQPVRDRESEVLHLPAPSVLEAAFDGKPVLVEPSLEFLRQPQRLEAQAEALARCLVRRRVRHLHATQGGACALVALAIHRRTGLSFSLSPAAEDWFRLESAWRQRLGQAARPLFLPTEAAVEEARSLGLAGRCQWCPPAVDRKGVVAASPAHRPGGALVLLAQSDLHPATRFHDLLEALARLQAQGIAFEFLLDGDGPQREKLRAQAAQLGLSQQVFIGPVDEAAYQDALSMAHVFVHLEEDHPGLLPSPLLTALAAGLPILASRAGNLADAVEDGRNGRLVGPGEVATIAETLLEWAQRPATAAALGFESQVVLESKFSVEQSGRQLAEAIGQAIPALRPSEIEVPRAKVLYLLDHFPEADSSEAEELTWALTHPHCEVLLLAGHVPAGSRFPAARLAECETLPDGGLLEAAWLQDEPARTSLLDFRQKLGALVEGERYFRDARRAHWVAGWLEHRGEFKIVHAARSAECLTTWLVHRLRGLPFSAAVEEAPALPSALLARLLPLATASSLASPEVARALRTPSEDSLLLGSGTEETGGLIQRRMKDRKASYPTRQNAFLTYLDRLLEGSLGA
ncbi:MAG: glycosyltransferase [Verrucomicrobiota bacterium]